MRRIAPRPRISAQWFVRGRDGQMAPFSAFAHDRLGDGADDARRASTACPSFEIPGPGRAGRQFGRGDGRGSSELAAQIPGTGVAWCGLSYQERLSSGQAPLLYALSLLVVFLCLAALYESWSIPVAVLLVIPLGLVGAMLRGDAARAENDVYLQIGLLTTMGLAAKNAILMIEFAEQAEQRGQARDRRRAGGGAASACARS